MTSDQDTAVAVKVTARTPGTPIWYGGDALVGQSVKVEDADGQMHMFYVPAVPGVKWEDVRIGLNTVITIRGGDLSVCKSEQEMRAHHECLMKGEIRTRALDDGMPIRQEITEVLEDGLTIQAGAMIGQRVRVRGPVGGEHLLFVHNRACSVKYSTEDAALHGMSYNVEGLKLLKNMDVIIEGEGGIAAFETEEAMRQRYIEYMRDLRNHSLELEAEAEAELPHNFCVLSPKEGREHSSGHTYGTHRDVWADVAKCMHCREEKPCFHFDTSATEYEHGAMCLECVRQVLAGELP